MAYLGNSPAEKYISFERQVFTIVNSQTAYTLDHSVTNENDIRLVVNNIVQEPGSGKAYTASGTTLTLSAALTNGTDEMYCVFLGRAVGTVNPPAGSVDTAQLAGDAVTNAKIADDAVESENLNDNIISGQTELSSEPADTDEFLVSDAGTLKRIDYSLIKGGGITNAQTFYNSTNKDLGSGTNTVIDSTFLALDTTGVGTIGSASNVTVSSGIFSFATTGYYLIQATMNFYMQSNDETRYLLGSIQATTNNSSYSTVAQGATNLPSITSSNDNAGVFVSYILDVTDTTNVKFRLSAQAETTTVKTENQNKGFQVQIIRLADT